MKRTAVYSTSIKSFIDWCGVRGIRKGRNTFFTDSEGEVYIPVVKLEDVQGQDFNFIEFSSEESEQIYKTCFQLSYRVRRNK